MHTIKKIALTFPLLLTLSGCVIAIDPDNRSEWDTQHSQWEAREKNNRQHIQSLQVGISFADITEKMGIADFNELSLKGSEQYQILYYRTQRKQPDGITTKDECTPLIFKENSLIGWGQDYLKSMQQP